MTTPAPPTRPLSRGARDARPRSPVRMVHLGLGSFFRAHQALYTDLAPDASDWGIAAFTGRSTALADVLGRQDCLYTLITRAADGDTARIVASISDARPGPDHRAWLTHLRDPAVSVLTLTVTEAGYPRAADGHLDLRHRDVTADLAALRADPTSPVRTTPARLVAGLMARRAAGDAPLAVVPCDNLPENGTVVASIVTEFADQVDPGMAGWIRGQVSFVTTMVDRITPAGTDQDAAAAAALTGRADAAPVVTEPYREWVLAGEFPAGRPAWDAAGALFVDDISPYEHRKLRLLNGGHSLLAYAGSARGHLSVASAVADPVCRQWLDAWWDEAAAGLTLPPAEISGYRQALTDRFANPRIQHLLSQIAADGSQKIPIRILPTVATERAAGRLPTAALRILAAWINHLRGAGAPVTDVAASTLSTLARHPLPDAVPAILAHLEPGLAQDRRLVDCVVALSRSLPQAAG